MTSAIRKRHKLVPYRSDHAGAALRPTSEINVTPLVDVCLVLLIIFMVVTPMIGRGRDVALPLALEATAHKEGEQVFVSIDDVGAWIDAEVYVEREGFLRELDGALKVARGRAAANGYEGPLLFIKGDRSVDFRTVKTVLQWISDDPRTQQHDLALVVALPEAG